MWCGAFGPSKVRAIREELKPLLEQVRRAGEPALFESDRAVMVSGGHPSGTTAGAPAFRWISADGADAVVWTGEFYRSEGEPVPAGEPSERFWKAFLSEGTGGFAAIRGAFATALWNGGQNTGVLACDHLGILPVYYSVENGSLVFGSIPELVLHLSGRTPSLDRASLAKFLTFCYNPGFDTLYAGVRRLRPGHALVFREGRESVVPYWTPRFRPENAESEGAIAESVLARMADTVRARLVKGRRIGVFLSGGLDSSSMVSLLSKEMESPLYTFSFRCRGESFDESPYAQIVSEAFGTRHTLVEYRPEDLLLLPEMVKHMDEPFCDSGINIATFLLARSAGGSIDDLFTGDGGDELFAGHPVYAADRAAAVVRRIPGFVRSPLFALGRRLSDSDRKKDWKVKVKRFSASYAFPESLGTHRWRAYYLPADLRRLLADGAWEDRFDRTPFEDIAQFNREGESADPLSQSLYADYWTVVHFYLRRVGLVRSFGIRPRFPLLDPGLVDFCAAIPSGIKVRGLSDVKRLEKLAVEPILPAAVVHRKDKLGHSIPMKNWMRDVPVVRDFMTDVLSESAVRRRGLFSPERVGAMVREHRERRENHAHRLWALMVLELWLQDHMDRRLSVPDPAAPV
jgi:asparagine synthase (glutamine-hydrolysing)